MEERAEKKISYLAVFGLAFAMFAVAVIPTLISTKGVWVFYGDFNVQQIPFYYHAHEAIRSGNFFYDWSTDIGGSLVGCYSFYLLGSPFFWLTIPFPNEIVPYLMPWISALKYAVMATTAFAYAKRHLKTETGSLIAAFLFAFSGYQGAVLVYNHFHDAVAFFPLYLILFEKMVEEKKRVGFTLMTALMVIINYYFFVGQAVFLVIYFVTKYCFDAESFKDAFRKLIRCGLCALTGVLLSGIYLIPAVYYTMSNSRVSDTLLGYDMIAYANSLMPWGIVKSLVMLPDVSGLNSMLNPDYGRVSGVAAYIPLFSIAGVIAFFLYNKGSNWAKRLIVTCGVFAFIPILNSMFSAFNSEYYARWFYMPVLIMAMATASVVEERSESLPYLKRGATYTGVITIALILCSILPAKNADDELTILGALKNPEQLISQIAFSVVMILVLFIYLYKWATKNNKVTVVVALGACFLTTLDMMITGSVLIDMPRKDGFLSQAIHGESPIPYDDGEFFRVETEEDVYNYPMFWNGHCINSFISTIPSSTIEMYQKFGYSRKVTSNIWASRLGLRTLLSGKYFFDEKGTAIETIGRIDEMTDLKGYTLVDSACDFDIYKNENFLPMGFCFDEYVTETEFEESNASGQTKDRMLLKVLILNDEVAAKFDGVLKHADDSAYGTVSLVSFARACDERRKTACTNFEISTKGFTADIDMEKENLVFFSVPYEDGFTAFVDGQETEIVKADYGFMAIDVSKGSHSIEFKYVPSNLKYGMYASIAGALLLVGLIALTIFDKICNKSKNTLDS